jgi:elongation factor G
MSSKSNGSGRAPTATTIAPEADPRAIRNVAVIGHSGIGKTTLVEHLLAFTGAINRLGSVPDGTTMSDGDPVEVAQQRSVFLSDCPLRWKNTLINLLDTPGFADFAGELRAGLRAADAALFVVSAADPIDELTLALWAECDALTMPRAVVINRLDAARADLPRALEECRDAFGGVDGGAVVPLYLPLTDHSALIGLLDSVDESVAADRAALIEAIIGESEDESLLEAYLGGEVIDPAVLVADLEAAVCRGHLHPVVPIDAATDLGLGEVLDLIVAGFPSPAESAAPKAWTPIGADGPALACDPGGPLAAQIVRTWVDPYVGRVSLARVFSGTIRADVPLHVSGHGGADRGHPDHDADERGATLLTVSLTPATHIGAGNLCVIARLATAETGDTISDRAQPLVILAWPMPEPLLQVAIRAATRNDEDSLSKGLSRLSAADPGLRIERSTETGQLVLWCQGEAHADVVLSRLRAGGAAVTTEPVRVSLRATISSPATGRGRHVKQSGGHGQFAVCTIEVEPLPRGTGVEFVDKIVGGVVPNQFIPSIEKGVRAQRAQGTVSGVPIVDVRVTLVDGKAHSVDSSDAAFQVAGALAIRDCAGEGNVEILEPVDAVDIVVSDANIGSVLSDLSGRRARVTGTEASAAVRGGPGHSVIHAEVPAVELLRYAATLRSITGGAATFHRSYLRHEPAAANVARTLLAG